MGAACFRDVREWVMKKCYNEVERPCSHLPSEISWITKKGWQSSGQHGVSEAPGKGWKEGSTFWNAKMSYDIVALAVFLLNDGLGGLPREEPWALIV